MKKLKVNEEMSLGMEALVIIPINKNKSTIFSFQEAYIVTKDGYLATIENNGEGQVLEYYRDAIEYRVEDDFWDVFDGRMYRIEYNETHIQKNQIDDALDSLGRVDSKCQVNYRFYDEVTEYVEDIIQDFIFGKKTTLNR